MNLMATFDGTESITCALCTDWNAYVQLCRLLRLLSNDFVEFQMRLKRLQPKRFSTWEPCSPITFLSTVKLMANQKVSISKTVATRMDKNKKSSSTASVSIECCLLKSKIVSFEYKSQQRREFCRSKLCWMWMKMKDMFIQSDSHESITWHTRDFLPFPAVISLTVRNIQG